MRTALGLILGIQVSAGVTGAATSSWDLSIFAALTLFVILIKLPEIRIAMMNLGRTRELEIRQHHLELETVTDYLTGITNRRGGTRGFQIAILRCRRAKSPVSFILADLDKFKQVNDTYGHGFGDTVICLVSKIIVGLLRATDISCRWGGDEILICLPDTDLSGALRVAEKLRSTVASLKFQDGFRVTASFGCTELQPGESPENVVARVDSYLYMAKAKGGNYVYPQADAESEVRREEKSLTLVGRARS